MQLFFIILHCELLLAPILTRVYNQINDDKFASHSLIGGGGKLCEHTKEGSNAREVHYKTR